MPIENRNELGVGKAFPPERARPEQDRMERFFRWSQGYYAGIDNQFIELQGNTASINRQRRFDSIDTPANDQERLTDNVFTFLMDFWQDAILEEQPGIVGAANEQPTIDMLQESLGRAARVVIGDIVRYGVGVFVNRQPGVVQAVDPRHWFPVRAAWDTTLPGEEILAWPYARTLPSSVDGLVVEEYGDGFIERRLHELESRTIGNVLSTSREPGPRVGAVVPVRGDDSDFYGRSDFANAGQFVAEIHRRESGVSSALDRHVNPHLAMPESAVTVEADGSVNVPNDGMVIPMPDGSANPEYVVWDPKLDNHERALRRAWEAILRGSRIAPILVLHDDKVPQLASGAALRRLAIPTVARIKELRAVLEAGMREAIAGAIDLLAVAGQPVVNVNVEQLEFEWPAALSSADEDIAEEQANGSLE